MKSYGLLFTIVLIVGCSNHDGGGGKAKLNFHVQSSVKQHQDSSSVVMPSQTSDFNCIGVFASSDLKGNRNCYNSNGSVIAQVHKGFGMAGVGNPFGGEMDPEENVVFYLVGMDYNDGGSCPSLDSLGQGSFENNSLVHILGESSPQSIVEGDNDISLSGGFGGSGSEIYYCEGAFQGEASLDCGTKSSYASIDHTYIECMSSVFSAQYFASSQFTGGDAFLLKTASGNYSKIGVNSFTTGNLNFDYHTYDSSGSHVSSNTSQSLSSGNCFDLDAGGSGACSGTTNFGIAAHNSSYYVFPRSGNGMKYFFPSISDSTAAEISLVRLPFSQNTSMHATGSSGSGDCVATKAAAFSKTRANANVNSTLTVSLNYDNSAGAGISFHSNLACVSGVISTVDIPAGSSKSEIFYIKTNYGSTMSHNIIITGSGVMGVTNQLDEP